MKTEEREAPIQAAPPEVKPEKNVVRSAKCKAKTAQKRAAKAAKLQASPRHRPIAAFVSKLSKISNERLITYLLVASISLCVLLFFFAVIVYTVNAFELTRFVNANSALSKQSLDTIRALADYYKEAQNFNVIALIYVLVSSVLVSGLGYFFKKAKDDMDKEKNVMEKQRNEIQDKVENMKSELERINVFTKYGNIVQHSYLALVHSSALLTAWCSIPSDVDAISASVVPLRDIFLALVDLLPSSTILWDQTLKTELRENLYQVKRLLDIIKSKSSGQVQDDVNGFLGYCNECIRRLR